MHRSVAIALVVAAVTCWWGVVMVHGQKTWLPVDSTAAEDSANETAQVNSLEDVNQPMCHNELAAVYRATTEKGTVGSGCSYLHFDGRRGGGNAGTYANNGAGASTVVNGMGKTWSNSNTESSSWQDPWGNSAGGQASGTATTNGGYGSYVQTQTGAVSSSGVGYGVGGGLNVGGGYNTASSGH
jgi:hypothetical protein